MYIIEVLTVIRTNQTLMPFAITIGTIFLVIDTTH